MRQLCLLGHTRFEEAGEAPVTTFGGVKPRQVLELLALEQGDHVDKDHLAERLWEGRPPRSFSATLESHVSVLRRHLEGAGLPRDVVRTVHTGYTLSDALDVDLTRLRHALGSSGTESPSARSNKLLMSTSDASWAHAAREELAREISSSCRRRAEVALRLGDADRAVALAELGVREMPFSEANLQVLLRALIASGAHCDALWSFAAYRDRLHEQLGVEPGPETSALYMLILRREAARGAELHEEERRILHRLLAQLPARP